jgi:hypothetical protein
MVKRKRTKGQTLQRELKIGQNKPHKLKPVVYSGEWIEWKMPH